MKSILILDSFITDESDENLLINFIDNIKSIGDDILLMSNTKISKTIQDKVNYFFYDSRNQLFSENYTNHKLISYYTDHELFRVSNIFTHSQPHGLSVLINLFRAVKIAKDLGYTHFYKMEYDAILGNQSRQTIMEMNKSCIVENKKGIFFVNQDGENGVEAHYFFCEIDFFLKHFWNISCEQDYIKYLRHENNNMDFITMEDFMYKNLINSNVEELYIKNGLSELLNDTYLNSKHTKVYYDERFQDCFTRFYLIRGNKEQVAIYSVNKKTKPDFRKIVVRFTDGNQIELHQEFLFHGSWAYHIVDSNIEKMMVYDRDDVLLFEDYFKDIYNEIEFY